jgi:arsenite-transporting ATPase
MDRIFPAGRVVTGLVRPLLNRVTTLPIAGEDVLLAVQRFYERLDGVRELLTNPELASIRLVVNPERIVIAEARRTATYLSLFGYRVDAVIANRLLPDEITDPWFKAWKETHVEHLRAIEEGFAPVPVLRAELAAEEPVGLPALRDLAERLYGATDPAAVMHSAEPLGVSVRGADRVLRIELPFADRDDLEVGRRENELIVRVGPHRRAIVLPDSLRRRDVAGASLTDGALEVLFAEAVPS